MDADVGPGARADPVVVGAAGAGDEVFMLLWCMDVGIRAPYHVYHCRPGVQSGFISHLIYRDQWPA